MTIPLQQLKEFVINYWQLWTLFGILLFLLIANEIRALFFGLPKLTPQELVNAINRDEVVVVDIRPSKEYQAGHILHAINIPIAEFNQKLDQLNKCKDKPIVIVCAFGQQPYQAKQLLEKQGFTQLKMLAGGLHAWQNAGLPLVKK